MMGSMMRVRPGLIIKGQQSKAGDIAYSKEVALALLDQLAQQAHFDDADYDVLGELRKVIRVHL